MRKTVLLVVAAAAALPACTTRGELRADRQAVREETAECRAARASGDRMARRAECADMRDARQELQEDRALPR